MGTAIGVDIQMRAGHILTSVLLLQAIITLLCLIIHSCAYIHHLNECHPMCHNPHPASPQEPNPISPVGLLYPMVINDELE